eukprot:3937245-Rhodomonas_salina.1
MTTCGVVQLAFDVFAKCVQESTAQAGSDFSDKSGSSSSNSGQGQDPNVCICPLSLCSALTLLLHGAAEQSITESEIVGHLDADSRAEVFASSKTFIHNALASGAKGAVSTSSVIVGVGLGKQSFALNAVNNGFEVIHEQPTKENIQLWLAGASKRALASLFDTMELDADVKVVLANVVQFKGKWPVPFKSIGVSGSTVHTPSMFHSVHSSSGGGGGGHGGAAGVEWLQSPIVNNAGLFRMENGINVLVLEYSGSSKKNQDAASSPPHLAVFVYASSKSGESGWGGGSSSSSTGQQQQQGADAMQNGLLSLLVHSARDAVEDGLTVKEGRRKRVQLVLPKVTLASSTNFMSKFPEQLSRALKQPQANFSAMTDDIALASALEVSRFQQKVSLKIDEKGTTAEASTGVEMVSRGLPDPYERVILDKPFVFM